MAQAVDRTGKVNDIHLTAEMIDLVKTSENELRAQGAASMANIPWYLGTLRMSPSEAILEIKSVKQILEHLGGFDVMSIFSALVLLPGQEIAIEFWVDKLLKKGGMLVVDVPIEPCSCF